MRRLRVPSIVLILFFIALQHNNYVECCNERKCASVVSKCLLAQSCKCEKNDYYCYQHCKACLGKRYYEACCDCVEICTKSNEQHYSLSKKSHVEDFEGLPELFNALVAEPNDDEANDWRQFTYPVEFDTTKTKYNDKKYNNNYNKKQKTIKLTNEVVQAHMTTINCTVIYLNQCTSWNKCRHSCRAIGANSYRWFHDGCCECIGPTCVNYGINESRCKYCPHPDDMFEDDEEDNDIHIIDFIDNA